MEISKTEKSETKTFSDSQLSLSNRKFLTLSGVEKVFETNQTKIQVQVSGCYLAICGEKMSLSKLDTEAGIINVEGNINELKYYSGNKEGFFKRIFK